MLPKYKLIARQQLDKTLSGYAVARQTSQPAKGWIRAIREALGMSGKQLANRLNVSQPRISKLEQDEVSGVVSLKTMRQAAEAMDCVFVYAIVPRTSLLSVHRLARLQKLEFSGCRTQCCLKHKICQLQNSKHRLMPLWKSLCAKCPKNSGTVNHEL